MRNLSILASILGSNMASKKWGPLDIFRCFFQDASKTPQDASKSAPRGPKSGPRAAKSAPRVPQDAPRAPQKPPKRTQPCPKERKNRKSCRKATIIGNNAEKPSQKHLSYQKICSKGRVLQCRGRGGETLTPTHRTPRAWWINAKSF